jgi:holin-like protein
MSCRQQRNYWIASNRRPVEILGTWLQGAGEVDLARAQPFLEFGAAMFHKSQFDAGVALMIDGEKWRKQGRTAHRRKAEPQHASFKSPYLVELGEQILAIRQQFDATLVDDFARRGQNTAVTDAIEQRHTDLIFQLLDRLADGGLGSKDNLGGLRKTALANDLYKGAEGSEVHRYSLSDLFEVAHFIFCIVANGVYRSARFFMTLTFRTNLFFRRRPFLQAALVLFAWLAGEALVRLFALPLPGGVLGFAMLLALLLTRRLSAPGLKEGADWFLADMLLFFVPAVLAVLDHPEFLGITGLKLILVILASTTLVMIVTALVVDGCYRWNCAHAKSR